MTIEIEMDNLLAIQSVLGQLGFTLRAGNEYYKDYMNIDGTYFRLVPLFDTGTSLDVRRRIKGFQISTQKTISVVEGIIFDSQSIQQDQLPIECTNDMTKIVSSLAPMSRPPITETFINTIECSMCGNTCESYVYINKEYVCPKCIGLKNNE